MKKWLLILLLGMGMPVFAGLEVAGIFAPHMVVQRNRPLPVWGRAAPGQMVTVTLGGNTGSVKADAEGAWRLVLPPHETGGPVEMTITAGEEEKRIGNILFGDVFLCSGQSNMEWHLMNTDGGAEAIATSADSQLRLFFSDRRMSESPEPEVRGKWYVASPKTTPKFSGVAYYFGRAMRRELGVPIGLINASRGASRVESWIPREFLATTAPEWLEEYRRSQENYEEKYRRYRQDLQEFQQRYPDAAALAAAQAEARRAKQPIPVRPFVPLGPEHPHCPGGLYNALIHPLAPFPLRGVIFYQGEADVARAALYPERFGTMLRAWRERFADADLPLVMVQLPNYGKTFPECRENQWADLRAAQAAIAAAEKNVEYVVTLDVGDPQNLHPRNKAPVGERLASTFLHCFYGETERPCYGPRFRSAEFSDGTAKITFDHAEGLKTTDGGPVRAFQLAGADGRFHWAEAGLDNGTVVVRCAKVPAPVAVRYAWEYSPRVNLVNGAGLPAAPFQYRMKQ